MNLVAGIAGIAACAITFHRGQAENDGKLRAALLTHQKPSRWSGGISIIISLAAALLVGWQGYVMQDTEHRQLRAYVLVESAKGQVVSLHAGEKLHWDIQYVNYGTTISLDEATDGHIWFGEHAIQTMEAFFSKLACTQPDGMAHFITPPNSSSSPGDPNFRYVTLFSDAIITQNDIAFATTHDGGAVMGGRVWYKDIFGLRHWTDFCRYTLAAGAISSCPTHNEVH